MANLPASFLTTSYVGEIWLLRSAGHGTSGAPDALLRLPRRALPSRNDLFHSKHRVPAAELEDLIAGLITDHLETAAARHAILVSRDATKAAVLAGRVADTVHQLQQPGRSDLPTLLTHGTIARDSVTLTLSGKALSHLLGVAATDLAPDLLHIKAPLHLRRRGVETRLISGKRKPNTDRTILKALSAAHRWTDAMRNGSLIAEIAAREGKDESYIRYRASLAFLSPAIQTRIINGTLPPDLTLDRLLRIDLPLDWTRQNQALGIET